MRKFSLVVTWRSSMLWSGRISLVVMISALVLTHSSAEENPIRKLRSTFFSSLVSKRHPEGNNIRHSKTWNGKETNRRLKTHRNWDMEPIIVKLNTVFDRYEFNWGEVKALYAPVEPCMPDKCGKTQHRKLGMPKKFKCAKFKRRKDLKKKLNIEIETLLTKKRLKIEKESWVTAFPHSGTLAYLKNELMTLQDSKKFLIAWKENLSNVFTCWNKMKRNCRRSC